MKSPQVDIGKYPKRYLKPKGRLRGSAAALRPVLRNFHAIGLTQIYVTASNQISRWQQLGAASAFTLCHDAMKGAVQW